VYIKSTLPQAKAQRRISQTLLRLCIFIITGFAASSMAFAQSTGWISSPDHPPVQLRVMLTGEHDHSANQVQAVLDVELEKDWKTYWRSPGEGGVAPELDWSQSENIADVTWHWPAPRHYEQFGVVTLGYQSHVSFPLTITLKDLDQPALLKAKLQLASCTTICVITDYSIALPINMPNLMLDQQAMFLFNQGMSSTPKKTDQVTVTDTYWDQANQTLTLQLSQSQPWLNPQVLVDGEAVVDEHFGRPKLSIQANQLNAVFDVSNWLGEADLGAKPITITVIDDTLAAELNTTVSTMPLAAKVDSDHGLIAMFGFALLGGLILNIMPCVLPVLGMKLNSVVAAQGMQQKHVRASFVASALGILTSFAILAAGLTVLKMGGQAIGWGIQFQSGWFITFLFVVTLLFAANLLGLFEVRLPSGANTWMALKGNDSHLGHFIQGMFATLLATPCSAPFLGTAVAYALGASYLDLWLIFFALGLGMSAPWLLFAAKPKLVSYMPKPGAWMYRVKAGFGVMMLATSLWLASLLTPFIGSAIAMAIMVLIVIGLIVLIGVKHGKKALLATFALVTVALGGGLIVGSVTAENWASPIVDDLSWQPLDANQIPQLVAQGKSVFVDVTADWCITCKANKIGVILQDPVYSRLKEQDIVLMKGDWTTPSDAVTQYLQSHQRYGVPFNIVYGPNNPTGVELPVILDSQTVLDTIKQVGE